LTGWWSENETEYANNSPIVDMVCFNQIQYVLKGKQV